MADLETYELTFDYLHNKNLKTISVIRQTDMRKGIPFGALTSENRDTWTHVRIPFSVCLITERY
jgi:hypothetical protein